MKILGTVSFFGANMKFKNNTGKCSNPLEKHVSNKEACKITYRKHDFFF